MENKNVAIIGCGVIGSVLADAIDSDKVRNVGLKAVYDQKIDFAQKLVNNLDSKPVICKSVEEIYANEGINLVIESASQDAVKQYAVDILKAGKDLIVISIGAFSDDNLFKRIKNLIEEGDRKLYIPSGAILGIDGIKAAEQAGIEKVVLTTSKPPKTLSKTEYVQEKGLELLNLTQKKVIFEGFAREAVNVFPKSVNVASTLSIAGIGFDNTVVKIVADPSLDRNIHQIYVKGTAGEFIIEACNVPSPDNPKTSYLAALSVLRMLTNLTNALVIGT